MSQSHFTDDQRLQNLELFGEYLRNLRKTNDEKKIKFAEKIFLETYQENINENMNSKDALQNAIRVTFCFLFEITKKI